MNLQNQNFLLREVKKRKKMTSRVVLTAMVVMILSTFITSAKAQCTLQCVPDVEVSLFNRNNLTITPDLVVINPYQSCPGANFEISVYDEDDNYLGDFVNYTMIDSVLKLEVEIVNHGLACSVDLTVVDEVEPTIGCQTNYVVCADSILPKHIGFPSITDNIWMMNSDDLDYTDLRIEFPCFTMAGDSMVTSKIERTWTAQDSSGNVGECVQDIFFLRRSVKHVTFPENRDGFAQPTLLCQRDNPNDLMLTGTPTIAGGSLNSFNNCELAISHTDDIQTVCGGEKRILRHWTVTDWCIDSSLTKVQVIRVKDLQAPTMVVPDTLEVEMNDFQCSASVVLPNAVVTDSCSQTTVVVRWKYGTGNGPYFNVPQGYHDVTYTATDECGNAVANSMIVSIWDKELPTPVCDPQKELSLSDFGTSIVPAATFDDGSRDNCGIDRIEAARVGMPFSEFVNFSCDDLDENVLVELKVIDVNGLENTCEVQVRVVDRIRPEITCPQTTTIFCTDNLYNLQITGVPTATDNCEMDTTTYADNLQLNACGIGTVERHWTAKDSEGNKRSCLQQIMVTDNTPITVEFPDDYESSECGADINPNLTGRPVIFGDDCENLEINFSDEIFGSDVPACYNVRRTWRIIDFCADLNSGAGEWTETQTISIVDDIAPVFDIAPDVTVGAGNNSCESRVEMADLTATDCSNEITITNNSLYADAGGANASGDYPYGKHPVVFTATDGCGNMTSMTVTILVEDDKPPTPVCNRGIALSLNSDGNIDINVNIIAAVIWDNCSSRDEMDIELTPTSFNCGDIGDQEVTVSATDAAGNFGFCTTIVEIQDNLDVCDTGQSVASIAGEVKTMSGEPAVQVLMGLSGGIRRGLQSNPDGSYRFDNLPKDEDYTVTPTYDADYTEGVSTLDLILITRHILNVEPFDTPYKWIAADADRSNKISTLDIIVLRKLILRMITEIPNNTSWRFIDANYIFPVPGTPLNGLTPEAVSINNIAWSHLNTDFIAVKVGDVDGSAKLNTAAGVDNRTGEEALVFKIKDKEVERGATVEIPFLIENTENLKGFQFTLEFDANLMKWEGITSAELPGISEQNIGQSHLDQGVLTFSWDAGNVLSFPKTGAAFNLIFTAKKEANLSEVFDLTSDYTRAEAYEKSPSVERLYDTKPVELEFEDKEMSEMITVSNFPNPFYNETTLRFELSKSAEITLKMYDAYGKVFREKNRFFEDGNCRWRLNASDFDNRFGVIFYRIEADGKELRPGKFIRIRE